MAVGAGGMSLERVVALLWTVVACCIGSDDGGDSVTAGGAGVGGTDG